MFKPCVKKHLSIYPLIANLQWKPPVGLPVCEDLDTEKVSDNVRAYSLVGTQIPSITQCND